MFRTIRASQDPKYIIDIIIEFFELNDSIAANTQFKYIDHPKSIKKKNKLTDAQLVELNDAIESIISVLYEYKFKVLLQYHSKKSYGYYVDFHPRADTGELLDKVRIRFRIANHKMIGNEEKVSVSSRMQIKSFYIGSKEYPDIIDVQNALDPICQGLKSGNYLVLRQY